MTSKHVLSSYSIFEINTYCWYTLWLCIHVDIYCSLELDGLVNDRDCLSFMVVISMYAGVIGLQLIKYINKLSKNLILIFLRWVDLTLVPMVAEIQGLML